MVNRRVQHKLQDNILKIQLKSKQYRIQLTVYWGTQIYFICAYVFESVVHHVLAEQLSDFEPGSLLQYLLFCLTAHIWILFPSVVSSRGPTPESFMRPRPRKQRWKLSHQKMTGLQRTTEICRPYWASVTTRKVCRCQSQQLSSY